MLMAQRIQSYTTCPQGTEELEIQDKGVSRSKAPISVKATDQEHLVFTWQKDDYKEEL